MNATTRTVVLSGLQGPLESALDTPEGPARGLAIIAHPHPLFGGTRDNKVVQTLARALRAAGCVCWRPDFRGVGASAGTHDEGRGETDDLLAVIDQARHHESASALGAQAPLLLAGFSFGAFVQTRVARALRERGTPVTRLILIAPAVGRFHPEPVDPGATLVVHGDLDDTVPLSGVLDWARPQQLPILVLPGADHFFHHRLTQLKAVVLDDLAAHLDWRV